MEEKQTGFSYTYSAHQQDEIRRIRQKYLPQAEDKMEQLRRLDKSVERPGRIVSIALGVVGTLLLGLGMCCTLEWADRLFVPGVALGLAGIAILAGAYPVYTRLTRRSREKLAPQILKLSKELLDGW